MSNLLGSRDLLVNLTRREVRGKYKRTFLGQGWSLLNPLASLLIFSLVFGLLLRASPPPGNPSGLDVFAVWLACGLLPWVFFSTALSTGMSSLMTNANLIKKVYFPREVLVVSTVLAQLVSFGTELLALLVVLLMFGGWPLPMLPGLLVVTALLTAFALGLALTLSIAYTYFRDTSYLMLIVLQFWFYLTPIVYPPSLVDDTLAQRGGVQVASVEVPVGLLYDLNPMARFTSAYRALLYDNRWPAWQDWVGIGLSAAAALVIGMLVFRRYSRRLAEEL